MQGDWNNNAFPVPVVWRWALITIELKTWVFSFTMKWKQKNISKRLINTFGSKVYIIHSLTNWTSIYPRWPVVLYITFSSNEKGYEYLQRITVAKQSLLWENEIQTRLFLVDWLSGSKERYWHYNRIQHKDIVMLFNWYIIWFDKALIFETVNLHLGWLNRIQNMLQPPKIFKYMWIKWKHEEMNCVYNHDIEWSDTWQNKKKI